jgi:hypothetical protein
MQLRIDHEAAARARAMPCAGAPRFFPAQEQLGTGPDGLNPRATRFARVRRGRSCHAWSLRTRRRALSSCEESPTGAPFNAPPAKVTKAPKNTIPGPHVWWWMPPMSRCSSVTDPESAAEWDARSARGQPDQLCARKRIRGAPSLPMRKPRLESGRGEPMTGGERRRGR